MCLGTRVDAIVEKTTGTAALARGTDEYPTMPLQSVIKLAR